MHTSTAVMKLIIVYTIVAIKKFKLLITNVTIKKIAKIMEKFIENHLSFFTKKENKDCFGGGSGAGVTIQPVAFLTVYQGDVRLVSVDSEEGTADKLVNMIPDVLKKVKGVFKKDKSESADDFSEITQDDIDG